MSSEQMSEKKISVRYDEKMRQLGMRVKTRKTYSHWLRSYSLWLVANYGRETHPDKHGKDAIERWLTWLAVKQHVSPRTQNVALQAILFLYHRLLGSKIEGVSALRARKSTTLPTALNMTELAAVLGELSGVALCVAKLQTGCGLRIGEAASLRIKDLDFERQSVFVKDAKGAKDRYTVFPAELHDAVRLQIKAARGQFEADRRDNLPGVSLPHSFGRKSPAASTSWEWFYLFPSGNISTCPDRGIVARHHVDTCHVNRVMGEAARRARVNKRVTSHIFRHTFGTYMLERGTHIRDLAEMMGHNDIRTTQQYLHCVEAQGKLHRSPFADLLARPQLVASIRERGQDRRLKVVG